MENKESNQTVALNFNSEKSLPPINNYTNEAQRNSAARQNLKAAENKIKGKGRAKQQTSLPDAPENIPINVDAILEEPEVEELTLEYLDMLLGKRRIDKAAREKVLQYINTTIRNNNPAIAEHFRNTCITAIDSLYGSGTKTSLQEYMQACLFVTYRATGDTKTKAYCKTFPERVMRMQREGANMAHLNSYAHIYSNGDAVAAVQAKIMLPAHIVCHDLFYEAMRVTADIMNDDKVSPKVRVDAANNIMNYTRQPEVKKQELEIAIKQSDEIDQLKNALFNLSAAQRDRIIEGTGSVVDVTKQIIYQEENNG